jgi:serine/threonine protein kinase
MVFNQFGVLRSFSSQQSVDVRRTPHSFPPPFERASASRIVCLNEDELFCTAIRKERKIEVKSSHNEKNSKRKSNPAIDQSMCVPAAKWQTIAHPTCNEFHSVDMASLLIGQEHEQQQQLDLLGVGGWRMAWKIRHIFFTDTVVLKTLRWEGQSFDQQTVMKHQIDAIAMDRLSSLKRVINIHGFCGHSAYNEEAAMDLKAVERGLTSFQKRIHYARDAALAVAALYEVDKPTNATEQLQHFSRITHQDVKPPNFVLTKDGSLKLNDFNDAVIVWRNMTSNGPCMFTRPVWSPYHTSPEEAFERGLTPDVDIFALGATLFYIVTGNYPHHELESKRKAFEAVARGILPELPYAADNPVVAEMQQIIHSCWSYWPEDRPRAVQIATELSNLLDSMHDNAS